MFIEDITKLERFTSFGISAIAQFSKENSPKTVHYGLQCLSFNAWNKATTVNMNYH